MMYSLNGVVYRFDPRSLSLVKASKRESPGQISLFSSEWTAEDEQKHKRDASGRFSSTGGGSEPDTVAGMGVIEDDELSRKIRDRTEQALRSGKIKRQLLQQVKPLEEDAIAKANQYLEDLKNQINEFSTEQELDDFDLDDATEKIQHQVLMPILEDVATKYPKEDFDTIEDFILYDEDVLSDFHSALNEIGKKLEEAIDRKADQIP